MSRTREIPRSGNARKQARSKMKNNFLGAAPLLLPQNSSRHDEIQFASRSSVTSESKEVHPEPNITTFTHKETHRSESRSVLVE